MTQPKSFVEMVNIWTANANQMLKGKVFSHIEYQTIKDRQDMGWHRCAPVIVFTDGTRLIAIADEELNEAGGLILITDNKEQIVPAI